MRPAVALLVGAIVVAVACTQERGATVPVSCGPAPSTNVAVNGAAAISPSDAWIVGGYQHDGPEVPLTEHWDGTRWIAITAPVGTLTGMAYLNAIAASASSDVWAVGAGQNYGGSQTLVEHWDGARWSMVPSPNGANRSNQLSAITGLGPANVWAVGDYLSGDGRDLALIEHWNGAAWSIVAADNPSPAMNVLSGVTAVAPGDIWAVGWTRDSDSAAPQTLIEHWDGVRWRAVKSPSPGHSATLRAVYAVGSSDVWAAGTHDAGTPLVEHWDGTGWAQVSAPKAPNATVQSIVATGSADVWLTGGSFDGHVSRWLVDHWDGSRWSAVSAGADATWGLANALVAGPGGTWAAGVYRAGSCGADWALVERWNGASWSYVRSPHDGRAGGQ